MKNLFVLITILFSVSCFAQTSQLFNNTWYLDNVIVDGFNYSPTVTEQVPFVDLEFYINNMQLETNVCNSATGIISFDVPNSSFTFIDDIIVSLDCFDPPNYIFEVNYFSFYLVNSNPYTFEISDNGYGGLDLVITSALGDEAFYGNELLSNQDFNFKPFDIYPNPASDFLKINNRTSFPITEIMVYDVLGRLISKQNTPTRKLDISNFEKGLLLVKIKTEKGVFVKKVMKE